MAKELRGFVVGGVLGVTEERFGTCPQTGRGRKKTDAVFFGSRYDEQMVVAVAGLSDGVVKAGK